MNLEEINAQLKPGGIYLEARGKKHLIRLICIIPTKEDGTRKQHKLSLGLSAIIPYQLKEAHRLALVALSLKTNGWDWDKWNMALGKEVQHKSDLQAGIDHYCQHRKATGVSDAQLKKENTDVFKKLLAIADTPSLKLFQGFIGQYPKNSAQRKLVYECCKRLCEANKWNFDLSPYKSTYGQHSVKPRVLPGDDRLREIEAAFTGHKEWRWALRMILCYGLRPHEVHFSSVNPEFPHECKVTRGKTGARTVYPYPIEWVIEWELWNADRSTIPLDRAYRAIGKYTSNRLAEGGAPKPYTFRHCYSLRGHIKYNRPARIMAALMGHSTATWLNVYSKWLSADMLKESYMESITSKD
jgi:hypothetical protein